MTSFITNAVKQNYTPYYFYMHIILRGFFLNITFNGIWKEPFSGYMLPFLCLASSNLHTFLANRDTPCEILLCWFINVLLDKLALLQLFIDLGQVPICFL